MDPENLLALEVVKVICLLVIAMSLYRATSSYFDGDMNKASLAHLAERSDPSFFMGGSEPPVFYNTGSFEEINAALQAAKSMSEANGANLSQEELMALAQSIAKERAELAAKRAASAQSVSTFAGSAVKGVRDFSDLENLAGAGL